MRAILRLVLCAGLGAGAAAAGIVDGWSRYTNPRFGASAEIPPDFVAGEEPANGDGLGFWNEQGQARISVYGSLNVENETLQGRLETLVGFAEADGWTVSYKQAGKGWIVQSGSREGRIFYEKIIPACGGDVFNAVRLEYRVPDSEAMDYTVTRVAGSLRHDPAGGCG